MPSGSTCAESIIAGVHFGEVSVDGGALGRVVRAVQAAVTDGVEIAAVWRRDKTRGGERRGSREKTENRHEDLNLSPQHGAPWECKRTNKLQSSGYSFLHQKKKKSSSHELISCCVDAAQFGVSSELLTPTRQYRNWSRAKVRINDRNQASDKCLGGKVSFLYVISAFKEMQVGSGVL